MSRKFIGKRRKKVDLSFLTNAGPRGTPSGVAAMQGVTAWYLSRLVTIAAKAEKRRKYPNAYAQWDADQDARLVRFVNHGMARDVIASEMGRQVGGVRSRIKLLEARGDL